MTRNILLSLSRKFASLATIVFMVLAPYSPLLANSIAQAANISDSPSVTDPTSPVSVTVNTYTIKGQVADASNYTVTVYNDVNDNGSIDSGDNQVAINSTVTVQDYSIVVPLSVGANNFLVTAKKFNKDVSDPSDVPTITYTSDTTGPSTPTANIGSGVYAATQSVVLSSTDEVGGSGLKGIYYTVDGSTPTNLDTEYTSPISVSVSETIKAIAYDNIGNTSLVASFTYTIDSNLPATPTITGFTQNNNNLVCSAVTNTNGASPHTTVLNWTEASNNISQYAISPIYPDGHGQYVYYPNGSATSVWIGDNFGHHGDGVYTYTIKAQGLNGLWSTNSASCSLVYDTTIPTVSLTPASGYLSGTKTFDITINDVNLDPTKNKSVWVYLYNNGGTQKSQGQKVDLSSGHGTFTVDTTKLDDGASTLDVGRVYDAAGNVSGASDNYFHGFTVDNTKPTVQFLDPTPANNTYVNTGFPVKFSIHDAIQLKSVGVSLFNNQDPNHLWQWIATCYNSSTLTGTDLTQDCNIVLPQNITDGDYVLKVGGQDAAGNWSVNATRTIKVQKSVPAQPLNLTAKFQYDATNVNNGSYLNITAKPSGNNLELLWDAPSDWVTGYHILSTNPDNTTNLGYQGPNTNAWLVSNGFGQHGQGKYTYQVVGINPNGESISSDTFILYYDHQSPTASFTSTVPTYVNGNFHMTAVANDNVALKNVFFDVRDSNGWVAGCTTGSFNLVYTNDNKDATLSCDINTSALVDGQTYTVRVHASDNAGYGGGESKTIIIDKTTPGVSITSPADNSFTQGSFTILGDADDSGSGLSILNPVDITITRVSDNSKVVDNQIAFYNSLNKTFSYNVAGLTDGQYTIQARANDNGGNSQDSTIVNITVDNDAPTGLSNATPSDGTIVNTINQSQITWNAAIDINGPITYNYESSNTNNVNIDGSFTSPVYGPVSTGTANFINTPNTPEGIYYWHVQAVDSLGNASAWTSPWEIIVDDTNPVVTINSYGQTDNVIQPNITATDTSIPLTYSWLANDTASTNNVNISDPTILEPLFTVSVDGTYSFTLTTTDQAGNSTDTTFNFTYTTPLVPLTNPNITSFVSTSTNTPTTTSNGFTGVTSNTTGTTGTTGSNPTTVSDSGNGTVLGESTNKDSDSNNTNDGEVKGAEDNKENKTQSFLGKVENYWWLILILIILVLGSWYFFAWKKRRDS
jgi:hypothetical protein